MGMVVRASFAKGRTLLPVFVPHLANPDPNRTWPILPAPVAPKSKQFATRVCEDPVPGSRENHSGVYLSTLCGVFPRLTS
jgi:hypothetical protein